MAWGQVQRQIAIIQGSCHCQIYIVSIMQSLAVLMLFYFAHCPQLVKYTIVALAYVCVCVVCVHACVYVHACLQCMHACMHLSICLCHVYASSYQLPAVRIEHVTYEKCPVFFFLSDVPLRDLQNGIQFITTC